MSDGAAAPTERLYYTDAYRAEFAAQVVDRSDDGRRIYLDQTAFYPTSGGQLNDLGTLGGIQVADVVDEDARIAHVLATPIGDASQVKGVIDWKRRFDHMQQHTGQHLVSAIFEDLFGMKTISVHFGDAYSTLDLEADALGDDRLARVERKANQIIAENRSVSVAFEDAGVAIGLRKKVDRVGELRIITIAGLDRSACGGTHVRATGEIGCALLRGTERIRKTIRVQFLCGLRAVERSRADYLALSTIAASLSASPDAVPGLVASQASQLKDAEQSRRKMQRELAGYQAKAMYDTVAPSSTGARIVVAAGSTATTDDMRTLGQAMLDQKRVIFVATGEGNAVLVAATEDSGADAGGLIRDALTAVGGKGGGSPRLAQGTAPSPDGASKALDAIRAALALDR